MTKRTKSELPHSERITPIAPVPDWFVQTFPISSANDPVVHEVHLEPGDVVEGIDFGNRPVLGGSIHGLKWVDRNGNAERDPDEPGLPGVTIYVDLNGNGVLDNNEPHALTMEDDPDTNVNEQGRYWLTGLPAGEHLVREVVPDGFKQTFPAGLEFDPALEGTDGVFEPIEVHPHAIDVSLAAGEVFETVVSLTIRPSLLVAVNVDVIASDANVPFVNLSGVQENGGSGQTSSFDVALFGDGGPQAYDIQLREVVPDGFAQTFPVNAAGVPGAHEVQLEPGDRVDRVDFGNRPLAGGSVHGIKWEDLDGDGQLGPNERGLPGVTIFSDLNENGMLDPGEPRTVTMEENLVTDFDEAGLYWLENLRPGLLDSIAPFPFPGGAHFVHLESGGRIEGLDFGNRPVREPGSIHGVKWVDLNGNGERDSNEPGLPGVTIYLDVNLNGEFDSDEPHAVTMESVAASPLESGRYWIENVEPGFYLVREVVPDGFEQTFPDELLCLAPFCHGRARGCH